MVEEQALREINRRLAASSLRLALVNLDDCELVEKNARYMTAQQFRRLVENIKRDGALTSVPFAMRRGEKYLILSGNHRVRAAREAGLKEIVILYTDKQLSRQEQVAVQLSHNAIVGQDDLAVLRELYDEITDVALKAYSGLDDEALGRMEPPKLEPLSEADLEYRVVSIVFLPEEIERAEALFDRALERAGGSRVWLARRADYERFLDAVTAAKDARRIKNTATAFMLVLDLAERHLEELAG